MTAPELQTIFSISLNKETMQKRYRHPIEDLRLSPQREFEFQNNTFKKVIASYNQSRSDLGFSP
jgi:hypothetical protein